MAGSSAALQCGQLAERMVHGYYAHAAAIGIARDPRAVGLLPDVQPGQIVPTGTVTRKDGTTHIYDASAFLNQARINPAIAMEFDRVWLAGALLALGDAAARSGYFDRAPELELLRHLRNGVAHGNRFRIDRPAELTKWPAHNRLAWIKSDTGARFEISPAVHSQEVLFSFMGPGDVLDLLLSVGLYLIRMANGDPLRPQP